ncbi:Ig-like domain-containing protein [Clostridium tagluense]|uniref:Ig-like domain-containing protein n=1 Tax=Clostridium tagluense TaxID=360422 RepID=UPI001CF0E2F3|nr:Ig-like domain-containing protein [Clostridium tagluense]MCB2310242.1 Ig-like domain-containing protein [Clostridium tagluense]MCB2315116.1 Ig-like domain-containing protein [Clostridium tagluense]MCB2319942.1 Ig-like domain-containing protein [Clostridium tagluense]MCB2324859.1 Ig-like domain-containing protein [Clostridium tagluense]MCB2329687.1 Ig-like domain-containing protein [Clostridium tagluense]
MKRVCKKIFFGLIFMVFIMSKSFNVLAVNLQDEQKVTKDKIWTITFNYSILSDELVHDNITVINDQGQKMNVILELSEDKKKVIIKPPIDGYVEGGKYQLNIGDKLQSIEGKPLTKAHSIMFVIEKPVSILKVNNINLSIKQGQAYIPQKKVTVDLSNGMRQDKDVIWDSSIVDTTKVGIHTLKGKVEGYESEVILTLTILKIEVNYNDLVKASPVIATISRDSDLYAQMSTKSNKLALAKKGVKVEVIKDSGYKWYYIKTNVGKYGWVEADSLIIPNDPKTNTVRLSTAQLEGYVNVKSFKSNTKYFMWVDLNRQIVNVFQGTEGKYKLLKTMSCATGRNISPTVRGTFAIQNRGASFFKGSSGAKNWVAWNEQYLFHSIIMDANGNVKDYTLGKRASAGCIRLSINDSKWVYDNMPNGTAVWVN